MSKAVSTAKTDPVVIVGIGVEAPGGIDHPLSYWKALEGERELIGPFPRDRGWPVDTIVSTETDIPGTVPDAGGFLSHATMFDPEFFGIKISEARVAMDPQQWVALRVAWRALEHSGVNPADQRGASAGCYFGVSYTEHQGRSGMTPAGVSGRISHCLGLDGPSMSVDTACSSGLSAVHLAAAAVRDGECDWALAGAVCVMGQPSVFTESAMVLGLSPDGRCRPFSDDACGTVWAEGAGVVVLELESRARRLGHRIYGRLLASRINHNGGRHRITMPDAWAQERLIRRTIAESGIPMEYLGLVEGHGAATRAGDLAELTALCSVFGPGEATTVGPLLGSVKSNLGHAQAAAGILGLIKVLLCGVHGLIAPTLHVDPPTTEFDWTRTRLAFASAPQPWKPIDGFRYGAVTSLGIAGTNAHAILAMPEQEE
ncbi:beta-ketoacyl [acyl carrier protein] synthase domain-containing protein [Nocardia mexicana]|uniref:Mycobactin polyketide synthetase MbtC n=1 Tax=Nocardia mexicana TaxID=279262 RepID=A0A370GFG8_9NOCA|nr:polyketide synthase [Nocardia mexicana]RDI42030.1 mycobactin polyketide synthetase MbtC [Nocardia mexicana]